MSFSSDFGWINNLHIPSYLPSGYGNAKKLGFLITPGLSKNGFWVKGNTSLYSVAGGFMED